MKKVKKSSQSIDFDFFRFFQKCHSHDYDFFHFFQKNQSHHFYTFSVSINFQNDK
jgi:hypothetical protein